MCPTPRRSRMPVLALALAAAVVLSACTVEAGDEAAHAIADRFAVESTAEAATPVETGTVLVTHSTSTREVGAPHKRRAESHRVDEEDEAERQAQARHESDGAAMLAQARAEADAGRKAAEAKRAAGNAAKEEARRPAEGRQRAAAERAEAERRARAQREADEAEMLARARAEAEERHLAEQARLRAIEQAEAERLRALKAIEDERRRAAKARLLAEMAAREEARRAEEERARDEERRRAAEDEARKAEAARREAELRQRLEEEERRKVEAARRAAEARRAEALRQLEEEDRRRAEQARAVTALAAEEARRAQAAQRAREAQQLSDRLRRIREHHRAERVEPLSSPHALGGPRPYETLEPGREIIHRTRVTVLLVMKPGSRGIRRFNKTADPILCVGPGCYISDGAAAPARVMTRAKAFGPGVAILARAGKCSRSLTCVFRNVDLERALAEVQPIDLRILRHDRREPRSVMADPTCRTDGKRLTCSRPVIGSDYKLWVVPESVAERAGALALETAVRERLPDDSSLARARSD